MRAGASAGDPGRAGLDPRRLVFIDETWIKTNMAPLRGWGPKGKRLRGFAPHGHWRTLTFLGALRCDRLAAPCVFDGPINGECFRAYVEQQLVPVLKPGDIVIMDKIGSLSRMNDCCGRVRRETGGRKTVQVRYRSAASHTDPKSCACGREAASEALIGECVG